MNRSIPRGIILRSALLVAAVAAAGSLAGQGVEVRPDEADAARLLALGHEGFRIHRTDHFLVASDGDDTVVDSLVERIESTYRAVWRFGDGIRLRIHPPAQPLHVLFFNRHSDFERYLRSLGFDESSAPGFYHARSNVAAFCNVLDLPKVREISARIDEAQSQRDPATPRERIAEWRSERDALVDVFNRLVIQHEAAHQVLFNIGLLVRGADNPDWLVEGLACQFEVVSPHNDRDVIVVNQMRLADFREAIGAGPGVVDISEDLLRAAQLNGRSLSLRELVGVADLRAAGESRAIARYAQAWALVDYLRRQRRDSLAAYLRLIADHSPTKHVDEEQRVNEFVSVFGPPDQSIERAWLNDLLRLSFDPAQPRR